MRMDMKQKYLATITIPAANEIVSPQICDALINVLLGNHFVDGIKKRVEDYTINAPQAI